MKKNRTGASKRKEPCEVKGGPILFLKESPVQPQPGAGSQESEVN